MKGSNKKKKALSLSILLTKSRSQSQREEELEAHSWWLSSIKVFRIKKVISWSARTLLAVKNFIHELKVTKIVTIIESCSGLSISLC